MPEYVYALHNFVPEHEDEIAFQVGQPIEVIERDDRYNDGWWQVSTLRPSFHYTNTPYVLAVRVARSLLPSNATLTVSPIHVVVGRCRRSFLAYPSSVPRAVISRAKLDCFRRAIRRQLCPLAGSLPLLLPPLATQSPLHRTHSALSPKNPNHHPYEMPNQIPGLALPLESQRVVTPKL